MFTIMGQTYMQAIGELFTVTRQVASGAKSALASCLVNGFVSLTRRCVDIVAED